MADETLEALGGLAVRGEAEGVIAAHGSLPAGSPADLYATLAARLSHPERTLALDTSGPPLKAMVGVPVAVAKPNLEELEDLIGGSLNTLGAVIDAANDLRAGGWRSVLVSLGEAGALLVSTDGAVMGMAPIAAVRNTVGAGDALLAGFLAGGESVRPHWPRGLRGPTPRSHPPAQPHLRWVPRTERPWERLSQTWR